MSSEPERRNITIRRAPKVIPFLVIGALLGLIGAGIIAFTGPEGSDFSRGTVLGFFSVLLLFPGLLLGALAALLFDWISVRRSRNAVVESTEEEQAAPPGHSVDDEPTLPVQGTDQPSDDSPKQLGQNPKDEAGHGRHTADDESTREQDLPDQSTDQSPDDEPGQPNRSSGDGTDDGPSLERPRP